MSGRVRVPSASAAPSIAPIKWSGDVEGFTGWSFHPSQMRPGDVTFTYRAMEGGREHHIHKQKTAPTKEDHAKQEGIAKKKLAKIKAKREKQRNSSNRRRRVEEAAAAEREETQRSRPSPSRPWKAWPP